MNRRTLYRVLAVAVALAAMSPLLIEADPSGGNQQIPARAAGTVGRQDLQEPPVPGIRPPTSEPPLRH